MKPIKYLFFALCFVSTFAVYARSSVEQDTIIIKKNERFDVFFSAKGQNLRIEPYQLSQNECQISDSIITCRISEVQRGGIAYIIGDSITEFSCSSSPHLDLNLRRCPSLRKLTLKGFINSLDLSGNINLEYFHCNECDFKKLQHLDMSHNPELAYLRLYFSTLTSLDISQNIKLDTFRCEITKIKNLDLSNNRMLSYISLGRNSFSPQELKSVFYSLHDNQIPGKKKEFIFFDISPLKIDFENGIIWNEEEKVYFDKNILKDRKWR